MLRQSTVTAGKRMQTCDSQSSHQQKTQITISCFFQWCDQVMRYEMESIAELAPSGCTSVCAIDKVESNGYLKANENHSQKF